ncbi:hypothetical protein ILUMI_10756 [Ignelater luminosus]|uniref:Uncharacterized protein n=1 Tax=Ignelater luminosus TaxID=2038154 RepID=A0A8K0CXI5_IGNLU|nr:hypothetical protein ILUMI_10756 [Ignelater luminosus]
MSKNIVLEYGQLLFKCTQCDFAGFDEQETLTHIEQQHEQYRDNFFGDFHAVETSVNSGDTQVNLSSTSRVAFNTEPDSGGEEADKESNKLWSTNAVKISASGLIVNNIMESPPSTPASANNEAAEETTRSDSDGPFIRKRKHKLSAAEERHREKLARQDKFLELFQKFIDKM